MRQFILNAIAVSLLILLPRISFSQCQPDTVNCKDVLLPGEICPMILPDGIVNEVYEEIFTIIPPDTFIFQDIPIQIVKIVIVNVGNLPSGLNYQTNSDTFYVDKAYCVLLSGTPVITGVYNLHIKVIPFVYSSIFGVTPFPAIEDSTSLSITIREPSSIDEFRGKKFSDLEAFPNPFEATTRIGFYTSGEGSFELQVYNLLGQLSYHENITGIPGKNYFNFNGADLKPGTFLYNISGNGNTVTKKLIRLK